MRPPGLRTVPLGGGGVGHRGAPGFPVPALPVQGGLPIVHQGDCVGAVGVSGVSGVQSHEDEQIASAGIAALG